MFQKALCFESSIFADTDVFKKADDLQLLYQEVPVHVHTSLPLREILFDEVLQTMSQYSANIGSYDFLPFYKAEIHGKCEILNISMGSLKSAT